MYLKCSDVIVVHRMDVFSRGTRAQCIDSCSPVAPARPAAVVVAEEVPAVEAEVAAAPGRELATEDEAALELPAVEPAPAAVAPVVVVAARRTPGATAVTAVVRGWVATVLADPGIRLVLVTPAPAAFARVEPAVAAVPAEPAKFHTCSVEGKSNMRLVEKVAW